MKQTGWVGGTTASRRHHRIDELHATSKRDGGAYEAFAFGGTSFGTKNNPEQCFRDRVEVS